MLYGLLDLSFWGYVVTALLLTHITTIATTVYLHRAETHHALRLHPAISHFFRFWLWLTTGIETKKWVAIHRKHHAKCETADDPHSPQILGVRKVLLQGAELYRQAAKDEELVKRYGHGTPDDWLERHLYSKFSSLGVLFMFLTDLLLFGVPGITVWAVQMMYIPFTAGGIINGIGHYFGYRNFECSDAARNIVPIGLFAGGEELHNNHHTFSTSAKLSVKWWEFDIGWGYIRTFQALGLAKVRKLPAKLKYKSNKSTVDLEALTAIIANRFQVMAHYSREVIIPVLKEEKSKSNKLRSDFLKCAKKLLIRSDALMTEQCKKSIAHMLKDYTALDLVYQYRLKLQNIWSGNTTASQRDLLDSVQKWCKEAGETNIAALRNFSNKLPKLL